MNDTPLPIQEKIREMFHQKTGEERLKMGCSMHDFSKRIVASALLRDNPHLSPGGLRREIFLKFYQNEFDSASRLKIINYLMEKDEKIIK